MPLPRLLRSFTPAAPSEPAEPVTERKLPPLADRTLADILELLCRPFHLQHIELKPGATTQDKTRALALPYVDSRIYLPQRWFDYDEEPAAHGRPSRQEESPARPS